MTPFSKVHTGLLSAPVLLSPPPSPPMDSCHPLPLQWSELRLGGVEEEPYLLRRNPSTNVVNPFGSSQCYGHGNLIFEVVSLAACTHQPRLSSSLPCLQVMENGHIASVIIFSHGH